MALRQSEAQPLLVLVLSRPSQNTCDSLRYSTESCGLPCRPCLITSTPCKHSDHQPISSGTRCGAGTICVTLPCLMIHRLSVVIL
jgi:hypothetical protein